VFAQDALDDDTQLSAHGFAKGESYKRYSIIIVERIPMLLEYIHNAMRLAKYELLDDGTFYGEIPGFDGVWAQAATLEDCREELQSALEDWLILGLRLGHPIPEVANIRLIPTES